MYPSCPTRLKEVFLGKMGIRLLSFFQMAPVKIRKEYAITMKAPTLPATQEIRENGRCLTSEVLLPYWLDPRLQCTDIQFTIVSFSGHGLANTWLQNV